MSIQPTDLQQVDYLEVQVLVDNVLDILSTVPDCVTSEIPNLIKAGAKELGGSCLCCGAWGLSLAITTRVGDRSRSLLFDTGPEAYALERNATRLGFDFGTIECAVVSHGHFDHAGGMPKALELITAANGGENVPTHVNPGMFFRRADRDSPDGSMLPLADVPPPEELSVAGAEVINSYEPRLVLENTEFFHRKRVLAGAILQLRRSIIVRHQKLMRVYIAIALLVASSATNSGKTNTLPAAEVISNANLYDGEIVTVVGKLDLSHFETVNIDGISVDWACYNGADMKSAEESWKRLYLWIDSKLDKSVVEIRGRFIIDKQGRYSMLPGTKLVHKIEYIKRMEDGLVLWVNCKFPQ